FVGSTVLSIYDRSVEYISGGSNVPEIRAFFWSWRRHQYPQTESSLGQWFGNLLRHGEVGMSNLGVFGEMVVEHLKRKGTDGDRGAALREDAKGEQAAQGLGGGAAPGAAMAKNGAEKQFRAQDGARRQLGADKDAAGQPQPGAPQPVV